MSKLVRSKEELSSGEKGDKTEDVEGKTATEDNYVDEAAVNDDKATPLEREKTPEARGNSLIKQVENLQQTTTQRLNDMSHDITKFLEDTTKRLEKHETTINGNNAILLKSIEKLAEIKKERVTPGEKGEKTEDAEGKTATEDNYVNEEPEKDGKAWPFVDGESPEARFNELARQVANMQQATNQRLEVMRHDITNLRQATTERLERIETSLERNNNDLLNSIEEMFAAMIQRGGTAGQLAASGDIAPGTASSASVVQTDRVTHGNAPGGVGMQPMRSQPPSSLRPSMPQTSAPLRPDGHPAIQSERSNVVSVTSDYSSLSNQ